tara:strand:- start:757 stop:936 length:180 start_codon:yes stop_codon:yes gene_type:complete
MDGTFTGITTGGRLTCAIGSDNIRSCWGGGFFGRLGKGCEDDKLTLEHLKNETAARQYE